MNRKRKVRIKDNIKISSIKRPVVSLYLKDLFIVASCFGMSVTRNSVLAGLRYRKFEAIHEEILNIVFARVEYFLKKHLLKMIGKVEFCQHIVCD